MSIVMCEICEKRVDTDWDTTYELPIGSCCEICLLDYAEDVRNGKSEGGVTVELNGKTATVGEWIAAGEL